jgi:hypothetical protein
LNVKFWSEFPLSGFRYGSGRNWHDILQASGPTENVLAVSAPFQ